MSKEYYTKLFEKYLNNDITQEEVRSLIRWMKSTPFDSWAEEEWNNVSTDMDPELQRKLFEEICNQPSISLEVTNKKRKTLQLWLSRVAVILLLFLSIGSSIYYYSKIEKETKEMIFTVDKGQKANVTLPDGTKVWVNSNSELRYTFRMSSNERILHLNGEAYFEVAPDTESPFTVYLDGLSVTALGTSFNIKSYEDEVRTSVILINGKVGVNTQSSRDILLPDERIIYDKSTGKMSKSKMDNALSYTHWRDNILVFEAETFDNIARILERYYNTKIVFESESLKKHRFTGSPGNTSLESILQILSLTSPLSYELRDSTIILRENTQQKKYYEKALR